MVIRKNEEGKFFYKFDQMLRDNHTKNLKKKRNKETNIFKSINFSVQNYYINLVSKKFIKNKITNNTLLDKDITDKNLFIGNKSIDFIKSMVYTNDLLNTQKNRSLIKLLNNNNKPYKASNKNLRQKKIFKRLKFFLLNNIFFNINSNDMVNYNSTVVKKKNYLKDAF
jgi:hypothetical protein